MTTRRANIYLIGPMGSGKTAVGKRLAAMLDKQFLDSDAEIERRCGVDIPYIFEKEGEARFRDRERDVISALTQLDGGTPETLGGAAEVTSAGRFRHRSWPPHPSCRCSRRRR